MELLVGIPTHKRPEMLRKCLESIARQEGELPDVRVFVADNDPAGREGLNLVGEVAGSFRFPISATVVEEPGVSAVRNAILSEAKARGSDFIAMIDDDEAASPQWLAELLKVQQEYAGDIVGGRSIRIVPETAPDWIRRANLFKRPDKETGRVPFVDSTANVLLSCTWLGTVGWPKFDRAYGLSGGGDTEFFLRARAAGAKFAWSHEGATIEPIPTSRLTAGWILRREFRIGNITDKLHKQYGHRINKGRRWAALTVLASPALGLLALSGRYRGGAFRRIGLAYGIMTSVLGLTYFEYAERHSSLRTGRGRTVDASGN